MRLIPQPPDKLSGEQLAFHREMETGIQKYLKGFISARGDGALVGPFNPMLHFPQFGKPVWGFTMALSANSTLPKPAHEVAILVTGARFNSRYELYAHEHMAKTAGLSEQKIATLAAGERPADLTEEEAATYDIAAVLAKGGQVPDSTYQRGIKAFGETGMAELIYLIGAYCLVSVLLNAYDISVPGREENIG